MKHIYYLSSSNKDLFPNNSSNQFSTHIQEQYSQSIPDGELEAAVKSISFENTRGVETLRSIERLGLRSNLSSKVISSGELDNIIAWFSLGKLSLKKKNLTFTFDNPSFFPTTKENLSRASFELVNLYNNSKPSFASNSNTFIQIVVRKSQKRMKKPFYVHLDSACKVSKSFFPANTATDFTIQLPNRLEFKKDWIIALKNFSLHNNIPNIKDCYITLEGNNYRLEDGIYTINEVILELNKLMGGILQFRGIPEKVPNGGKIFVRTIKNVDVEITFSINLAKVLGLSQEQGTMKLKSGEIVTAKSKWNLTANLPRQLIITCDIIENSLFAGEMKQVLRIISLPDNHEDTFFNFEFLTNEYLKLESKSFDKIRIKITDFNGAPVKILRELSTRLQILFLNINSA